jgi:ABC-type lipoprotein export system ATPase subunit
MIIETENNCIARLVNVNKVYNGAGKETAALMDVSFQACAGEMVLLLGPSGSGKTTLLTLLAGLQQPSAGEVYIYGQKVNKYTSGELQKLRANRIGFIFQTFYLLDSLTVLDNVLLVMKFSGAKRKDSQSRALHFLERFGIKHLVHSYPKTLSQGEKQRVAIARALVNGAELIIADEPTGSLATNQGMTIVKFLKDSVKTENRCVVIASHDERIAEYADRVLYLHDGKIRTERIQRH